MRVFLDANILFSASKSEGAVHRLLGLLTDGGHEIWVDAFVIEEARRNLAAKYPGALGTLDSLLSRTHRLASTARLAVPDEVAALLPEKDRPVLAAAIRAGCDALVTGDRAHFGPLRGRTVSGVTIHSPATLAKAVFGTSPG